MPSSSRDFSRSETHKWVSIPCSFSLIRDRLEKCMVFLSSVCSRAPHWPPCHWPCRSTWQTTQVRTMFVSFLPWSLPPAGQRWWQSPGSRGWVPCTCPWEAPSCQQTPPSVWLSNPVPWDEAFSPPWILGIKSLLCGCPHDTLHNFLLQAGRGCY